MNSKDYTSAHFSINVIENFHISSVLPSRGSTHGGTKYLRGNGFTNTGNLYCVFNLPTNDVRVGAFFYRAKKCRYNTYIKMTVHLLLLQYPFHWTNLRQTVNFVYESHLIVDEILPVAGTTAGGTDVQFLDKASQNQASWCVLLALHLSKKYVNSNE